MTAVWASHHEHLVVQGCRGSTRMRPHGCPSWLGAKYLISGMAGTSLDADSPNER